MNISSKTLVEIFQKHTKQYGPTPTALNAAVKEMDEKLTGEYSQACFRNQNRDLVPGIMRKHSQIWEAACRQINKDEKNIQLNSSYWSNKLLISLPTLASKAFPGREVTHNLQAY